MRAIVIAKKFTETWVSIGESHARALFGLIGWIVPTEEIDAELCSRLSPSWARGWRIALADGLRLFSFPKPAVEFERLRLGDLQALELGMQGIEEEIVLAGYEDGGFLTLTPAAGASR